MSYRRIFTALGASAAAALAACSGTQTSSVGPSSSSTATQVSEDMSEATANEVTGSITEFGSSESGAGASALVFRPAANATPNTGVKARSTDANCSVSQVSAAYTYPANDPRDTVNFTRSWQFFSTAGCENSFVADSTDSIAFSFMDTLFLNGKHEHWHGHRYANRSHWLTGDSTALGTLLSAQGIHVWNGNALVTDTSTFTDPDFTASYAWVANDTAKNITFPHPRSGDLFPISGSWTRWLNGTVTFSGGTTGAANVARHIVVTFSENQSSGQGSTDAQLQIFNAQTGALIKTCTVDLLAGEIVPGSCH